MVAGRTQQNEFHIRFLRWAIRSRMNDRLGKKRLAAAFRPILSADSSRKVATPQLRCSCD